jgi:predicted dehydrogenase
LLGQVLVRFPRLTASLQFNGNTRFGPQDRSVIVGTQGTLVSEGPDLNNQEVTLYTDRGRATPRLDGTWFTSGFEGTMGELLQSLEEGREPYHAASDNLPALAMAFAAMASARRGKPVKVGEIKRI